MMEKPHWLPSIVNVDGEWNDVLSMLYGIFERDIKQAKRFIQGKPVWWNRQILEDGQYEEGFWHLISKDDQKTKERLFDPRRAERLPWCGPTISSSDDSAVKVWDFKEASGRVRTYVWLEDWDYVLILEKRPQKIGEIAFLITAFYVNGDSKKRDLRKKLENKVS